MRKSKIMEMACEISRRVTRWLYGGRLLSAPGRAADAVDAAEGRSRFCGGRTVVGDRPVWDALRPHATEALLRRTGVALLRGSMENWGIFFVLYGGASAGMDLLALPMRAHGEILWISAVAIAVGIPCLQSSRSLSYALRRSCLIGGFLIGFCGVWEEELGNCEEHGERHPWIALGGALICAAVGRILPYAVPVSLAILPLVLLLLRVPELLLTVILIALPFLGITGRATVILTSAVLVLELAWLRKYLRGQRTLHKDLISWLVFLFGVSFLFGGIFGAGGFLTLTSGITRAILVFGYFPAISLRAHPIWQRRFTDARQLGGLTCGFWGVGQYFFTDLELQWVDSSRFFYLGGRVCAGFSNPNILSVYLLLLLPEALACLLAEGTSPRRRCFYGIAFGAQVACLVLTWTRGAWLGALVSLLLLLLLQSDQTRACLLLGSLPAMLCLPLLPGKILRRFGSIGSLTDSSTRYRLYTWKGVGRMMRAYPWGIGTGEAAFTAIYPTFAVSGTERVMHAHQLLLQVGVELGIAGVLLFCGILGLLLLESARGCGRNASARRVVLLGAACGLIGVLVMGMFDYVWYQCGTFFLFWETASGVMQAGKEHGTQIPIFGRDYA